MGDLTEHKGTWTLEDQFSSRWQYLPIEVAPGTATLRVKLEYERDGAVLDLGCLGPSGFRGWSGGARDTFTVSVSHATPGYLPGEIEPGLWQVFIGLHQVPAGGVRYRVTAETMPAAWTPPEYIAPPVPGARPVPRELPASAGRRWLAGDLHSHTLHSDGSLTVPEIAALAVSRGLEYLAITDHNTTSHHRELPAMSARYGITLVPGQEVTTAEGHAGILGDTGWIDFRRPADDWLDAAEAGGGLMSVNHPVGGPVSWLYEMKRRPPLAEVWHWSWLDPTFTHTLAWWHAWGQTAIPVGGSDWHRDGADSPLGAPTTWVEAECGPGQAEPSAILDALREGRVAISASREGPVLLRHDGDLVAAGADGLILAGPEGGYHRIQGDLDRVPGKPGYHRLVTPGGGTLALVP